ncbi:MAG: hypothetical protein AABX47_05945 [Nanoarchaeota archaeon]
MMLSERVGARSMRLIALWMVLIMVLSVVVSAEGTVCPKQDGAPADKKKTEAAQSTPKEGDAAKTAETSSSQTRSGQPGTEPPARTPTALENAQTKLAEAQAAQIASSNENAIKVATISAQAQVQAAGIQAAASVMSALIGAAAQMAGQKDSGGEKAATEVKAPETGATEDLAQLPPGAVAEITPRCVGLVAPTEAQIKTCTALGYVLNGNVLVPANQATVSNNNKANGPNILVPVGSSTTTIEQLVNLPPGGVVESTVDPASGGIGGATGGAISAPIRIKDVLTEGVVIGDFRTNTIARYPAVASGDRPPLKVWATGASVWGSMPALWPQYQMVGKPLATFNYQTGGASDNPPPQTINFGQIAPNFVKIVPNIDDARIDLKGTDYDEIATVIRDGKFYGSAENAGLLAVEARTIQRYLLQSPTGGASYVVAGPYVRANDGGKIIQSSLRVGPDTLTPQQCEILYGAPCR